MPKAMYDSVEVTMKLSDKIVDRAFEGKHLPNEKKTFYIKYGPPASGKGDIMKKVVERDHISRESLITVEVDSIIQQNPNYERSRKAIIDQYARESGPDKTTEQENALQELYFTYRYGGADTISDQILNRALQENYNIAWETTGNSIDWTRKEIERIKKLNYTVKVVYPLVPLDTLRTRAAERQQRTGQTPAPEHVIKQIATNAARNILELKDKVDEILMYNNSGAREDVNLLIAIKEGEVQCHVPKPRPSEEVDNNGRANFNILVQDEILKKLVCGMCSSECARTAPASASPPPQGGGARGGSSAVRRLERATGSKLLGFRRAHNMGWIQA